MNNSKQLLAIARTFHRNFSKSASVRSTEVVNPKVQKLRETQRNFQIEDGTPVYIKGGIGDKILYQLTLTLTAIGVGMSLETFYKITFK